MTNLSASVVIYNTPINIIDRLLNNIINEHLSITIYLIDNSTIDMNYDFRDYKEVKYIKSITNVGYGSGHNIAIRYIINRSKYHFIINPDIYFNKNSLGPMINKMDLDSSIGQLMPKVLYPDGNIQYLCKLLPTPIDLILRRFSFGLFKNYFNRRNFHYELRHTGYSQEMNVPYLSGCFMLFRVDALKKIGLFDESFFMYPEDIDITRRMHKLYRTIFFPSVYVIHDHAKDSYKNSKMMLIHIVNMIKYFNKWGWIYDPDRSHINKLVIDTLDNDSL